LRLLHFPDCQSDQNSIKEYDLNKVVDTLIESGIIRKWFDVKVNFFSLSNCHSSVKVYLKAMSPLPAPTDKPVHKHKPMKEDALQQVVHWAGHYLEAHEK
jgi:hypothetical protein